MKNQAAGILLFRRDRRKLEVLLGHPGGPYWAKSDRWSIPKGKIEEEESIVDAAEREFCEEVGFELKAEWYINLKSVRYKGGKEVWALATEWEGEFPALKSNLFEMEWPKKSGKICQFPEFDRIEWFDIATAKIKILEGQLPLIDHLLYYIPDFGISILE